MNPQFLKDIKKMLKADEGWSPTLYQDSVGTPTIGFGTNITRITREEGEALLTIRLNKIIEYDLPLLPEIANLNNPRLMVYVNMLYNLGINRFKSFRKMRACVAVQDWNRAAENILYNIPEVGPTSLTKYHRQVGKRAERLAAIMRSGEINNYVRAGQSKNIVIDKPNEKPFPV